METFLEIEFKKAVKSVNKKLILSRCKKYNMNIGSLKLFGELSCFYMKERSKMKDWDLSPEDFLNPDMILQDEIIKYILAKKSKSKHTNKIKRGIYDLLEIFLMLENINLNAKVLKQKKYLKIKQGFPL